MLTAEGRNSISRAGRLNPDKCARKLNCPVVLNKKQAGVSAAVQFSPGFSKSLRKSCGREGGRDGNAIAPSRRCADGHGLRDREKRKEKRERSDLGKVLCAIHVRPFSPSPLLKPLCCRRKDRSCQRGWLQIKNLACHLPPPTVEVFRGHS